MDGETERPRGRYISSEYLKTFIQGTKLESYGCYMQHDRCPNRYCKNCDRLIRASVVAGRTRRAWATPWATISSAKFWSDSILVIGNRTLSLRVITPWDPVMRAARYSSHLWQSQVLSCLHWAGEEHPLTSMSPDIPVLSCRRAPQAVCAYNCTSAQV